MNAQYILEIAFAQAADSDLAFVFAKGLVCHGDMEFPLLWGGQVRACDESGGYVPTDGARNRTLSRHYQRRIVSMGVYNGWPCERPL